MKKLYTLALTVLGTFAFAQTPLNINGSLEEWSDGNLPAQGWHMQPAPLSNGIITKIEGDAQDGVISLKLKSKEGNTGNNNVSLQDIEIVGGQQYTISYWYKSAGTNFKFRHWGQWRTSTGNISVTDDPLQSMAYAQYAEGWTNVVLTSTAPAEATVLRLSFRNYTNSSDVYIDNVVVSTSTVSVESNSLSSLSIYPNPVTGSQFFVDSDSSSMKSVVIFDVLGKQVLSTMTSSMVNVHGLPKGVYIVKVSQDGNTTSRKLVIK
ncbi:MAG: T9SS type A sorting domain-containing protein [Bacteroidota bacterium]|nr:T9SS type A sorting domain-containing protein [Bacteroidota bacterium]